MVRPSNYDMPLLSEREFNIFSDPFVYGYVDDFLPARLYQSLESHFPALHSFPDLQQLQFGKQYHKIMMGDPVDNLVGVSTNWRIAACCGETPK